MKQSDTAFYDNGEAPLESTEVFSCAACHSSSAIRHLQNIGNPPPTKHRQSATDKTRSVQSSEATSETPAPRLAPTVFSLTRPHLSIQTAAADAV
jgi:hypothetical protein